MDFEELIDELETVASFNFSDCYDCNQCIKAATAIKALLAERDAAINMQRGDCRACKHRERGIHDYPCVNCYQHGGMSDYWEWGI